MYFPHSQPGVTNAQRPWQIVDYYVPLKSRPVLGLGLPELWADIEVIPVTEQDLFGSISEWPVGNAGAPRGTLI